MYSNNLICDILNYIDEHINDKISIDSLASTFYFNRFYIMKLFKRELNISINEYINCIRIYNSTILIRNSNYSIMMIGLLNGFYSLEYFSETFKKIIGVSPLRYKKYCINRFILDENDINTIINGSIYLESLVDLVNNYKKKKKPMVAPVRKLSIFD